MPHALLRRWFDLLSPQQVVMAYGMTENFGVTALRGDEWLEHPGSVGRGFGDTEICILDSARNPVATGELGDIYLRAPMRGLPLSRWGTTLPSAPDGFQSAGDIGYLDADGYLYVTDRRADLIITGGANVYPAEVESALAEHAKSPTWSSSVSPTPSGGGACTRSFSPPARPVGLTADQVIAYAKTKLAPTRSPRPWSSSRRFRGAKRLRSTARR